MLQLLGSFWRNNLSQRQENIENQKQLSQVQKGIPDTVYSKKKNKKKKQCTQAFSNK